MRARTCARAARRARLFLPHPAPFSPRCPRARQVRDLAPFYFFDEFEPSHDTNLVFSCAPPPPTLLDLVCVFRLFVCTLYSTLYTCMCLSCPPH